ncbi:unnamed protein product [marine sediment metagenome]|uniref:Uncharacterized protein n=1 Tax=marine sediment metagenome TaxID=412755 RepID=X0WDE2_9ZZZZ
MRSEKEIKEEDFNHPKISSPRIPFGEIKGEPRYSVADLEKIFEWIEKNGDCYMGEGSEVTEFIAEFQQVLKDSKRVEKILNE